VLAVGNSFRLPNGTDGRPIPPHVKLIHINADPADLNKTYQADVPILADAKLALRALFDAVRDRLGPGRSGIKEEIVAEIQQARDKWLGEWMPVFTDESMPTNGYRVVYDLMQVVDRDRTIAIHDAGGSRGYSGIYRTLLGIHSSPQLCGDGRHGPDGVVYGRCCWCQAGPA
jgi:thiamine pyrophosphate-dependent acetolactate synthase large subunit-like protein